MSIKVDMSPLLARYAKSQFPIEIEGDTVEGCLKNLEKKFPKLKLFEKDGRTLSYLIISVNKEVISPEEIKSRPVKEGDELQVMLMLGGG